MPNSELFVGDFNIHVCCPTEPLVTLLILLSLLMMKTWTHFAPCFILSFTCFSYESVRRCFPPLYLKRPSAVKPRKSPAPARKRRIVSSFTAAQFSVAFHPARATYSNSPLCLRTEALFCSACKSILESVAPLKTMRCEPWHNYTFSCHQTREPES